MRHRCLTVFLVALLGCSSFSCASAPPPAKPPPPAPTQAAPAPEAPKEPETAPTPYSAEEIRDACPVGRRIVFRVVDQDRNETLETTEFVKSDAAGADMRMTTTDTSGKVLKTEEGHATWEELRDHAKFPKDATSVVNRTTMTPLGTLDCLVYKVARGEGPDAEVSTFHFAKKMPGPPVLYYTDKGGKRVRTATMESSSVAK